MRDFIIYASVGLCLLIAINNWIIWRDIKNPAVLHSFLWLTIVGLHTFAPHGLNPLKLETYSIIASSMLLFSGGVIFGFSLIGARKNILVSGAVLPNQWVLNLYFYLALIGLPFLVMKALNLASHGATDNFLINLRMSLTDEDDPQGFGIVAYFMSIAYSYFFICLLDKNKSLKSKEVLFSLIICLIYAVFNTGRTFLFLLFIPSLFILSLTRSGFFTLSKVLFFLGILLLVFVAIGSVLGKLGGDGDDAMPVFWLYLLGGITAFQEIFSSSNHLQYGNNTFRTIYAVLAAFGFNVEVKSLMQGYVYIPAPTNVYTVFQPYFKDFGIYFALVMQFLLGMMHAVLYKFSKLKDPRAIVFYSLSIYPLFMQWFQDQYATLMSTWVFFGIVLLIPFIKITTSSRRSHPNEFGERFEN